MIADIVVNRECVRLSSDLLGSVSVPTLFLWGKNDAFGDESVARGVVESMPRAEPGEGGMRSGVKSSVPCATESRCMPWTASMTQA